MTTASGGTVQVPRKAVLQKKPVPKLLISKKNEKVDTLLQDNCGKAWKKTDDKRLAKVVCAEKIKNDDPMDTAIWERITRKVALKTGDRTPEECYNRWTRLLSKKLAEAQTGVKKGTWAEEEDILLRRLVHSVPYRHWGTICLLIPGRSAKQCRERWCYSLDPKINKGEWTEEEDRMLLEYQTNIGNRWAYIASRLPGRTENAVKTRYKSIMRAKQREWREHEDKLILKMHHEIGSKWDLISEKFPNRTKNAVRTRYRQLLKERNDMKEISKDVPNNVKYSGKLEETVEADKILLQLGKELHNNQSVSAERANVSDRGVIGKKRKLLENSESKDKSIKMLRKDQKMEGGAVGKGSDVSQFNTVEKTQPSTFQLKSKNAPSVGMWQQQVAQAQLQTLLNPQLVPMLMNQHIWGIQQRQLNPQQNQLSSQQAVQLQQLSQLQQAILMQNLLNQYQQHEKEAEV